MIRIHIAADDDAIRRCYPVMHQLRPHLNEDEFVPRVKRMQSSNGFFLAALEEDGAVRAVAGYRYLDLLFSGMTLYVDDLITDEAGRSRGYGSKMMAFLREEARKHGCKALTLDSGVHREHAHRFYFRERMKIAGFHFSEVVE